jgi:nucleoside-diphosphate kinase
LEQTLAIIKPDAVQRHLVGIIISEIEKNDFRIAAVRTLQLSPEKAASFYAAHQGKPFFDSLVAYTASGQIYALLLEREHAVEAWRQLMGPTRPELAAAGTIRRRFAIDMQKNSVHGADSPATAAREIQFFFGEGE